MERKVIVIVGPTCSGKSQVALNLAERLNTEIISADSRQIYKYLSIGTAKPTENELSKIKHHFIDVLSPNEDYNVSRFEGDALKIIDRLSTENKIPIVAGGSGLYVKALVDGIINEVSVDEEYRQQLRVKREIYGNEFLYNELKKVDPVSASKMLPQNWKRVMRALEVYHLTGKPIWEFHQLHKREADYQFCQFGLMWEREVLYRRIEERVDSMIENGLIEEVRNILSMGFPKSLNSLNTVGYKEIISFLENEITLDKAVQLIKRNTRRFAKRQLTWFRKDNRIKWIQISNENDLLYTPDIILKSLT
ncbi:MAG: tRNA (adenosine(37)-N6)-dimethylallyltransferase MiaA [Melioribacter sp.]|uniref:tRNA (adenosine(37)-N6)-dimethylallyltransferase MiaA n=1 Tax=Rosettibacter primus TaxID=3111523 RepID=UPI00247BAB87|nr:tRNA (adenosine(37)-N6)-dimethylallyltransferase MiaA [Melioribacter sp.]